ncbi:ImmA/IrrE family metallo-endopeptidase [Mesobacillus thioparans]|uniref:ImmA/IrrE family metallo-endopeptidase n=1 Tax=Mesobacillus thioparans TaxID=370439 RepID=UPI0039EF3869
MKNLRQKVFYLFFLLPSLALIFLHIKIPQELEWNVVFFLCIMVIFDRMNLKMFSGFRYSFFHVMLSLIIFDRFSVVYGFIYLLVDSLFAIFSKKRGSLKSTIALLSMYIIIIIACNEVYNDYTDKMYLARYLTLILMLALSMVFKYIYVWLETGAMTSKMFIDRFGPMTFEVLIIFPILAFYDHLDVNLVLTFFLSYYTFIGFLHRKFMAVNHMHIDSLTARIEKRFGIQVLYRDLSLIKGIYHPGRKMIIIDEKLDYPEQIQTIVHELLHHQTYKVLKLPDIIVEMIITLFEAIVSWYYIISYKRVSNLD